MNDEHPTQERENQSLSDRELEIMSRLRENPELAEQIYALLGEIGGPEDGREHSFDEMEENVVERARKVARQILEQSAQAQEKRLNQKARTSHPGSRTDRKKNSGGKAPLA